MLRLDAVWKDNYFYGLLLLDTGYLIDRGREMIMRLLNENKNF